MKALRPRRTEMMSCWNRARCAREVLVSAAVYEMKRTHSDVEDQISLHPDV